MAMVDLARYRGRSSARRSRATLAWCPAPVSMGLAIVLADKATSTLAYSDAAATAVALAKSLLRAGRIDEGGPLASLHPPLDARTRTR